MLLRNYTVRQVEHHKLMCQHSQVISHYIAVTVSTTKCSKAVGSVDCPITLLGAVAVECFTGRFKISVDFNFHMF